MKKIEIALALLMLLCLCACTRMGTEDIETFPPLVIVTTEEATEATTEPTTEEPTEETTEEPTEPPTESAPEEVESTLIFNGETLTLYGEEGYLKLSELAEKMDFELTEEDDGVSIANRDDSARLYVDQSYCTVNEVFHIISAPTLLRDGEYYVSALELFDAMRYPIWEDTEETGLTYVTPAARPFKVTPGVNVPILMYHAVSDYCWGISELFVRPSDLEDQIVYMLDNGYDPIWFEDLNHLEDYDKPVLLTFDDGYDDNYTDLYPILQKYQVKATIFIITRDVGIIHKMPAEQVRELADSGLVSIQSHTYSHEFLSDMGPESTRFEMSESRKICTRITGRIPYVVCYPTGKYNDYTLTIGPEYYTFGLKMNGGLYNTSDSQFLINRYYVPRDCSVSTVAGYIASAGT